MKIDQLIHRIAEVERKYESKMQPPCNTKDLDELNRKVEKKYRVNLPDHYLTLLSLADGVLFNGVEVFGSKPRANINNRSVRINGILEANRTLRIDRQEDVESLLVFAYSEMDLWALDLNTKTYKQHSHSGDDIVEFKTFEELMTRAFESRLPAV